MHSKEKDINISASYTAKRQNHIKTWLENAAQEILGLKKKIELGTRVQSIFVEFMEKRREDRVDEN